MKALRDRAGFYDIGGKGFISSTTVIDRLEKYGLHPWIARTTAEYMRDEILNHLIAGDMTIEQLRETDLELLMKQAKQAHEQKKKEAMDIGSGVHKAIEEYYKHGQNRAVLDAHSKMFPVLTSPLLAFIEWESAFKINPIDVERTVFSKTEEYAGTLDLHCYLTVPGDTVERVVIIDHKAAAAVYDGNVMQIASYAFALLEELLELDGAGILRLDKETGIPEFRLYSMEELEKPYKMFLSVLDYCKWERAWKSEISAKKSAGRRAARKAPKLNLES